ncbi:MAG TPA: hypothetical protein EYN66_18125 [Myxococcales bacterium]|nr:hypothetical protein [Myxococcales bacterium]
MIELSELIEVLSHYKETDVVVFISVMNDPEPDKARERILVEWIDNGESKVDTYAYSMSQGWYVVNTGPRP